VEERAAFSVATQYRRHAARRWAFEALLLVLLCLVSLYALNVGSYSLGLSQVAQGLVQPQSKAGLVLWGIRLPRITAALLVGAGLGVAGAVMQCLLRNPLASPFTMGISHGAMFGACLGISLIGAGGAESSGRIFVSNPYVVVALAFCGSLLGVIAVLILARLRGLSPAAIILAGIAMGSLFTAGTTLVQYFAEEHELAAMVYWSFGDLGRPVWRELAVIAGITLPAFAYFNLKRWDYNAMESGDEAAKSLGVAVHRDRLIGMLLASLVTAVGVGLVGIIGFVDLICPHAVRLLIGGDHRFLLPGSALLGALLLLLADTAARGIIAPTILPVGVLTSFLGAPMLIYLLVHMEKRV